MWCSTAQDSLAASITVSDTVITRRTQEEGFKALGVWITFDGHFIQELAEREVSAWRCFCALRRLLCDNNVALKYMLRLLTSCVVSSMVCRKLVSNTMCTFARSAGPHAEKDGLCPKTP